MLSIIIKYNNYRNEAYKVLNDLINPSTLESAYFGSISLGLIVAAITGLVSFNCGENASSLKQKGNGNGG